MGFQDACTCLALGVRLGTLAATNAITTMFNVAAATGRHQLRNRYQVHTLARCQETTDKTSYPHTCFAALALFRFFLCKGIVIVWSHLHISDSNSGHHKQVYELIP